ncbi:MAG: DNA-directed DNA polymerase II small subunit [Candidatus Bathyarchaeota archaeon]|nr:MAG: DNA-directed DNA polymerase II small subunit [Candidatus Bathyarchaeota archaeon]
MSEELRQALGRIIKAGYQLSADGYEFLGTLDAPLLQETVIRALSAASKDATTILDSSILQKAREEYERRQESPTLITAKTVVKPLAKEHDGEITVLDTGDAESSGNMDGFIDYFRSRFNSIERILRQRIDMRDAVTIGRTFSMPVKTEMKVIGIVTEKRSSGSRLFIELEDAEDSITVMASDGDVVRKGLSILRDQVVCVNGLKYRPDLLIANDFIWPDLPTRPPKRAEVPLCAAFLADVHVGSINFNRALFERFIQWLNLEVGPPQSRLLASRVKYLIIAGDLVDGIGVYPTQLEELEIHDIRKQYEVSAQLLSKVPEYVEIIVLPGNHDAVRKSLPQPPISEEYAEGLHQDDRIHLYGNPSKLLLHGVEAYVCHGKALDEILSQIPGMDFHHPLNGMELLLRCRHVAPTFGNSTPIAPEKRDRLVIEETPDIFQMGHIHVHGVKKYKGTTMIASGSWQEQTLFQMRVSLEPTVGVAPVVDLQTHQVYPLDFKRMS